MAKAARSRGRPGPAKDPAALSRWLEAGAAHATAGRLAEAARAYAQAERLAPSDVRPLLSLATVSVQLGRPVEALPRLRRAARLAPDLFDVQHNLGAVAQSQQLWVEAAAAYERALALRPEAIETRRNLATVLALLGRIDAAAEHHRHLASDPTTRPWALTRLALLRPGLITDADIEVMRAAGGASATDAETRIGLWFALGEALEARGRDDEAFAAFAEGNRRQRARLAAGPPGSRPETVLAAHARAAAAVRAAYSPDALRAHEGSGLASVAPIFIVGMPRSGSTLIDQILASHPRVQSLGESAVTPTLLEAGAVTPEFAGAEWRELARATLKGWRRAGWTEHLRPVDKTLENFLHVGALALMFPRAVFLHSVRDPLDTCFSCYRQLFARGAETLYDLGEIAAEHAIYRQMMVHWAATLPGRVIDVSHEALIDDPATQIRWLVTEACGLAWDDACLSFHVGERAVRTASSAQVRQPIFRSSLGRWRRYERHLAPLFDALGPYRT